jgi:hypothetical protein
LFEFSTFLSKRVNEPQVHLKKEETGVSKCGGETQVNWKKRIPGYEVESKKRLPF